MADRWIIVENRRESEQAIKRYGTSESFLATSVESCATLSDAFDVEFETAASYLPYDEQNQISLAVSDCIESVTTEMSAIFSDSPVTTPDGFRPLKAYTFLIKKAVDALLFRHRHLQNFIETEQPSELAVWGTPERGKLSGPSTVYSRLGQRLFGSTTTLLLGSDPFRASFNGDIQWQEPIKSNEADGATDERIRDPTLSERFNTVLVEAANRNRVRGFRTLGGEALSLPTWNPDRLLVLDALDPITTFARRMSRQRDIAVDWWTKQETAPVSLASGRTLVSRHESRSMQHVDEETYRDIVARPLQNASTIPPAVATTLGPILARHLLDTMSELLSLFETTRAYCTEYTPSAILSGVTDSAETQVIAQAADLADVPFVAFQHGGNYGYNVVEKLRFGDLAVPDLFCTLGDGVTRSMKAHADWFDLSAHPVTVGTDASNCETSTTDPPSGKNPMLLFISTGFRGDLNYGPYYFHDDIEYYQHLRDIVETLTRLNGFDLTCKFHPKDKVWNPLVDKLRSNSAVDVYYRDSFSELLSEADVVILDYPSTTLLETLLAGKPLVYLDIGWYLWMPEGKNRLKNSVYWVDGTSPQWRQKLADAIDTAVTNGKKGEYRDFLQAFSRPTFDATEIEKILFR